jgi:hypothetical protein
MKKSIFIKTYEKFNKSKLNDIIKNDDTYIKKKSKEGVIISDDYIDIKNEISKYDVSNFYYKKHSYGIYIKPDFWFIEILKKLNLKIENKISLDLEFDFSVDETRLNLIDFEKGIPVNLKGYTLGYKLYKLVILDFGFITSNKFSSLDAYNIWYNLLLDDDLYSFTSNNLSGVISKKLSNNYIFEILEKLKYENLKFDDELIEKIKELYGSLDIYTQRN